MDKKAVVGWLMWAILFFVLAVISAVLGYGLIAGVSFELAKWFAIAFAILFVISVIAHTIKTA